VQAVLHPPRSVPGRLIAGFAAAALLAGAILVAGPGAWQVWAFLTAPDLPLLAFAAGSREGRLDPRAVPLYNAVHRIWGPLLLGVLSLWLGPAWLAGALAWGAHVAIDRAAGYGLRAADGSQRGA
jgi:hypothetical protein